MRDYGETLKSRTQVWPLLTMKRTAAAAAANGQRRHRPRHVPEGPDVPDVPGVPPDLTPLMLEALRSATKFFQYSSTPFDENGDITAQQAKQQGVVESILNRMDSVKDQDKQTRWKERMGETRQSWLAAVKLRARDNKTAVSCFRYLWGLGQNHGRVAVRRASLNLCGYLLQKSSDCRMYIATEDTLFQWVTCVAEAQNLNADTREQAVSCWRKEALSWSLHLSDEYGDLYPKYRVALQFLEQKCLFSVDDASNEHFGNCVANMPDLRRTRDIAMKYGDIEIGKVEKLIKRAHRCLDVLVPRFGNDESPAAGYVPTPGTLSVENESSDEDEGDIEWEDGDTDNVYNGAVLESHEDAVERTLEAMASSRGLQGGAIEIDLNANYDDDSNQATDGNVQKRLQKSAQLLESRHMKRLTSWIDALTKADNLLHNGNSLVVMSVTISRKRADLLQRLLDTKRTLASILSSAAKLGVTLSEANGPIPAQPAAAVKSNMPLPRQRTELHGAARRRTDRNAGRRSTKIQIKYRST